MEAPSPRPASRAGIRIGIDGTCLALKRGYGRFLSELIVPLLESDRDNEYTLFVDHRRRPSRSGIRLRPTRSTPSPKALGEPECEAVHRARQAEGQPGPA
jgi:hypothetical protein